MGCQVDEDTYFGDCPRGWPVDDFFDILGVWATAILVDYMREEPNLGSEKLALVQVEDNSSFLEGTKDCLDMLFMFLCCLAEN